jgi:hypothetical protein
VLEVAGEVAGNLYVHHGEATIKQRAARMRTDRSKSAPRGCAVRDLKLLWKMSADADQSPVPSFVSQI